MNAGLGELSLLAILAEEGDEQGVGTQGGDGLVVLAHPLANDLDLPFLDAGEDLFVVEEVEVRDAYELIDST